MFEIINDYIEVIYKKIPIWYSWETLISWYCIYCTIAHLKWNSRFARYVKHKCLNQQHLQEIKKVSEVTATKPTVSCILTVYTNSKALNIFQIFILTNKPNEVRFEPFRMPIPGIACNTHGNIKYSMSKSF